MGENIKDKYVPIGQNQEKKPISVSEDPNQSYMDWLDRNLGEEASRRTSEKIVKMMLKAESKWQIGAMKLFLKANSERGDEYFDKTREVVVGIVQGLPKYPLFQEQGPDKQAGIQRWLISTYVGGFLNSVRGNTQFDSSVKGIAWSLLAKDAKDILAESGQTINSEWLFETMGPLIRTNANPKAIGEQLSKFSRGDPQIIHN